MLLTCPAPACVELNPPHAIECETCGCRLGLPARPPKRRRAARTRSRPRAVRHCPPPVLAELERRAAAGETVYALARELLPQTTYPTNYAFRQAVYKRRWKTRRRRAGRAVTR